MATIRCREVIFPHIEGVIFDKDGTLEDSQNFLRELGQKRARLIDAQIPGMGEPLLMSFGIQDDTLDPTGLMAVGTRQENEIAAAAYIAETGRSWFAAKEIAHQAFAEADRYLQRNSDTSPLFTGSLQVIRELAEAGLKLGILSSDSTTNVQAFVQSHQLSDYFQLTMGAEPNLPKPEPRLFLKACQKLGVAPEKTLMVGDSQGDIIMAKKAGAAGIFGICWGQPEAAHLETADVTIAQLDEIQII